MPSHPDRSLVSCIMPTFDRRRFVPHAIHYFLRQDYPARELIIVDDGGDAVRDLVPDDPRIRYFRLEQKATLGAKLNFACEHARGAVIAHWDDDDWYAANRISYQIEALAGAGTDVCGINDLLYLDVRSGRTYRYVYPANQRLWLSGSTLCYAKAAWTGNRFADIDVGMDAYFVWGIDAARVTRLPDSTFAVHIIHPSNGSPKATSGAYWQAAPEDAVRNVLKDDWALYQHDGPETPRPRPRRPAPAVTPPAPATPVRNVFACLVHESRECVIDLVRNLRYHDPSSTILLYNGGNDPALLGDGFPFARYGALAHPTPRPLRWGWLHPFALDCMQFALEHLAFDTLTIVDSDQLALRPGYSAHLGQCLAGQSGVGLLCNAPGPQAPTTDVAPVQQAFRELDLWRPFLARFPDGERQFAHWAFWPSSVFTRDAARDLVRLFDTDEQLQGILARSKMWATEEVVLPTLVALLGYRIVASPCSYEVVKFRTSYARPQIDAALASPRAFWIHPIARRYDDPARTHIRNRFDHYQVAAQVTDPTSTTDARPDAVLLTVPILDAMRRIEGWLEDDEADLLIAASARALAAHRGPHAIVEIGSYCGRSTVVLASVAKTMSPGTRVYAVDPHDGKVGALDQRIDSGPPTLERFRRSIELARVADLVEVVVKRSYEVEWSGPIRVLLIDGLHDYANVARDFFHFDRFVEPGGLVAFHDYADYYPGVQAFVNELLASGEYRKVHCVRSMMVVQKQPSTVPEARVTP